MASCGHGEVCDQGNQNASRVGAGVTEDYALEKAYHCDGKAGWQMEDVAQSKHMSKL